MLSFPNGCTHFYHKSYLLSTRCFMHQALDGISTSMKARIWKSVHVFFWSSKLIAITKSQLFNYICRISGNNMIKIGPPIPCVRSSCSVFRTLKKAMFCVWTLSDNIILRCRFSMWLNRNDVCRALEGKAYMATLLKLKTSSICFTCELLQSFAEFTRKKWIAASASTHETLMLWIFSTTGDFYFLLYDARSVTAIRLGGRP